MLLLAAQRAPLFLLQNVHIPFYLAGRFYMQYFEAILLELEEQGYEEAYHHMVEFFKLDDQISERTPGMISWKKPQLRYQKDLISCLKNGFIAYEKCRKKGMRYRRDKLFGQCFTSKRTNQLSE